MKRSTFVSLLALLATVPLHATTVTGYVSVNVHLRAGPDIGYPSVVIVPAGTIVQIEGCIDDWAWCDVVYGSDRGWIAGTYLQDEYAGQPVLVPAYGARLGIPVVSFSITAYWGRYYVDRPFYRERERWYRHPPRHAPPPPPVRALPYPGHPPSPPEHPTDIWRNNPPPRRIEPVPPPARPPSREQAPRSGAPRPQHPPATRRGKAPPPAEHGHDERGGH